MFSGFYQSLVALINLTPPVPVSSNLPSLIVRIGLANAPYQRLYLFLSHLYLSVCMIWCFSGLHSGKYDHLQKTLTTIQQQLANFIESEKRAMEERIR